MKTRSVLLSIVVLAVLASEAYCPKKRESLVVASKVKAYIKSKGMMTSSLQPDRLPMRVLAPYGLAYTELMGSLSDGEVISFVQRVITHHAAQAKLEIGLPRDIYEREADRMADQVIRH